MKADVFLSYKSEEEEYARKVRKVLEDNGISCWMAPDSIPVGSNYMKQIPQAIDNCKVMIVLISEKSQKSTWVKNEFSQAITKNKLIIPYLIQDCQLEDEFAFSMSTMQQVYAWKNEEDALNRIVKDIREALGDDPNARIEISVVKKPKVSPIIIGAVAAIAVIGLFLIFFNKPKNDPVSTPSAEVYYSEILPFYLTGFYQNANEARNDSYSVDVYDKAFSLLSFIRNDSDKSVFVEKIACDIDEVVLDSTAIIQTDSFMKDDTFYCYTFNDGWGDGENITSTWQITPSEGVPVYDYLITALTGSDTYSLKSGEAHKVYKIKADLNELLEYCRQHKDEYLPVLYTIYTETKYGDHTSGCALYLMYDRDNDCLFIDYGGADDEKPEITLYAVLDVDNPPKELRFNSPDAFPLVEDTFRIETVIIPTKSCNVTLNGSYSVGGNLFETEKYNAQVRVPYFDEGAIDVGGPLTRELAQIDSNDTTMMKKICNKYRYDIESILPDDVPRG